VPSGGELKGRKDEARGVKALCRDLMHGEPLARGEVKVYLDVGRFGCGVARLGKESLHPFDGVNKRSQGHVEGEQDMFVVFGLDRNIVSEACGDRGVVKELTRLSVFQEMEAEEKVVFVCSEGWASYEEDGARLLSQVLGKYKLNTENMLPYGSTRESRALLAEVMNHVSCENANFPLLVASSGGAYVGLAFESTHSYSTIIGETIESGFDNARMNDLAANFFEYGTVSSQHSTMACYDLLGSLGDPSNFICLLATWDSSRNAHARLLAPPALVPRSSVLALRGSPIAVPTGAFRQNVSSSFAPDKTLEVLCSLSEYAPSNTFSPTENIRQGWRNRILDLSESVSQNQKQGITDSSPGSHDSSHDSFNLSGFGDELKVGQDFLKSRTDLDFSENFWDTVVLGASNVSELFYAIGILAQLLKGGDLLPFIHKSNNTLVGKLCREAIHIHVQKERNELEGSNTKWFDNYINAFTTNQYPTRTQELVTQHLARLGKWKLQRDFKAWFREIGISQSIDMEWWLDLGNVDGAVDKGVIAKFTHVRNMFQLIWTAGTLRTPIQEIKSLAVSYLAYYKEQTADQNPIFVLPITSQLPWVRDDAAGIEPLPTPRLWQLTQTDDEGKVTQTTRVMPHKPLALAKTPISKVAANKAVEKLTKEATNVIRSLLTREAPGKGYGDLSGHVPIIIQTNFVDLG